ncbi:MAG: hypothetical protein KDD19_17465 [Phaeodactylibacter sp.]|nr:hypothetical protein [Phaeodactylibacter sp.]MCB9052511.1 hypothetical protein [Lewinellaceae bacterium]
MELSRTIFWDTNYNNIDWEKSSSYVISKVVMYGTIQDWYSICTFYGMDRIKNEMKKVRYLDDKSLAFLSIIFDEPKENFRCYTWKQSTPQHWTS